MKVALVGGSPLTRDLAPYDSDWEIWVLANQLDRYAGKRIHRVFEIHDDLSEHADENGSVEPFWEFVCEVDVPRVVSPKYAQYGEPFPYEEANEILGAELLTSSPAYMMAYAFVKYGDVLTDIGIWGVEMALDDHEYFKQRPAMYAWIAHAKSRGVRVTIPKEATLFKEGYCEGKDWNNSKRKGPFSQDVLMRKSKEHEARKEQLMREVEAHNGASQVYRNLAQVARAQESGVDVDIEKSLALR